MKDPVEKVIADGLTELGIEFEDNKDIENSSIDFYLPDFDLWIEVCQFYTPRKIKQLSCLDDVILIQGLPAAKAFIKLLQNQSRIQNPSTGEDKG